MNRKLTSVLAIAIAASSFTIANAAGRDVVNIVGSSTVYPFARVVA